MVLNNNNNLKTLKIIRKKHHIYYETAQQFVLYLECQRKNFKIHKPY